MPETLGCGSCNGLPGNMSCPICHGTGRFKQSAADKTPETVEVNVVMGAQLRAIVRSALLHVKNKLREEMNGAQGFDAFNKADIEHVVDEELEKWPLSAEPKDTLPEWLFHRFGRTLERPSPGTWDELEEVDKEFWKHEADAVRRAVGRGGFKTSDPNAGSGFVLSTPINELHQVSRESDGMIKSLRPLDLKHTESLGEAIRIAVGAASTCWTNLNAAGVFKSEEALDIAAQLEHHFHSLMMLMRGQIEERHQALGDVLHKYYQDGHPMISVRQAQDILCGRSKPEEYKSALQVQPTVELWPDTHLPQPSKEQGNG